VKAEAEGEQGEPGAEAHLDPEDLESMTVTQLKKLAGDMELEAPERATKKQLIELIAKESVMVDDAVAEVSE